jgi:hypothetical protein
MTQTLNSSNLWIDLRRKLAELEEKSSYAGLDTLTQRLLEWIHARTRSGGVLYVQEIVMQSGVASPATIHKGLVLLERSKLISLRVDDDDARRRIVTPTGRADAMLDELARGLEEWIDSWLGSQDKSS